MSDLIKSQSSSHKRELVVGLGRKYLQFFGNMYIRLKIVRPPVATRISIGVMSSESAFYEKSDVSMIHPGQDDFTWDYCLVFKIGDHSKKVEVEPTPEDTMIIEDRKNAPEDAAAALLEVGVGESIDDDVDAKPLRKQKMNEFKLFKHRCFLIMRKLFTAGLNCYLFETDSVPVPMVPTSMAVPGGPKLAFLLVGACERRLESEADRQDYPLRMNSSAIIDAEASGEKSLLLAKRVISEHKKFKHLTPQLLDHLYARYDNAPELQKFYTRYSDEGPNHQKSLFRAVDRLKLTFDIIQNRARDGGASLLLHKLKIDKSYGLEDYFPLHDSNRLGDLRNLMAVKALFFHPNTAAIREYYGEHVGMYFAFLAYWTKSLFLPGTIGLVVFIVQLSLSQQVEPIGALLYTLFICIWATCFLEQWKQEESRYACLWGCSSQNIQGSVESARPEFRGKLIASDVTGRFVQEADPNKQRCRWVVSYSLIWFFVAAMLSCVVGTHFIRDNLVENYPDYGSYYASAISSMLITLMNTLYGLVSDKLNALENHKQEEEFENSKIIKGFIFRFINSYNSIFYIAFWQRFQTGDATCVTAEDPYCITLIQESLLTIFITQLIINNLIEFGLSAWRSYQARELLKGRASEPQQCELEYQKGSVDSTLADYDELVVTFGYAMMFAVALPIGPILALVCNAAEMNLDIRKYLIFGRRPQPRNARSIGAWYDIINFMTLVCVTTNLAIFFFVAGAGTTLFPDDSMRFLVFIGIEHAVFICKLLLSNGIPDEQDWLTKLKHRQAHIRSVLIDGAEEEAEDVDFKQDSACSYMKECSLDRKTLLSNYNSITHELDFSRRREGEHNFRGVFAESHDAV